MPKEEEMPNSAVIDHHAHRMVDQEHRNAYVFNAEMPNVRMLNQHEASGCAPVNHMIGIFSRSGLLVRL